jgi:hypothetical protein
MLRRQLRFAILIRYFVAIQAIPHERSRIWLFSQGFVGIIGVSAGNGGVWLFTESNAKRVSYLVASHHIAAGGHLFSGLIAFTFDLAEPLGPTFVLPLRGLRLGPSAFPL